MNDDSELLQPLLSSSLKWQIEQSTKSIAEKAIETTIDVFLSKKSESSARGTQNPNRQQLLEMAALCRLAYVAYEQIPDIVAKQLTSGQLFSNYQFKSVDFLYNDSSLLTDEDFPVCCGYVTSTEEEIFVVLRGTKDVEDWLINLLVNTNTDGIHSGFAAYADSIWQQLQETAIFSAPDSYQKKLILVGHSLGGAGVSLIAHQLNYQSCNNSLFKQVEVYTFGCPPVSTTELIFDASVYRIRNSVDLIPYIPKLVSQLFSWLSFIPDSLQDYQELLPEYVIDDKYQIYQRNSCFPDDELNRRTRRLILSKIWQIDLSKPETQLEQLIGNLVDCFYTEHRMLSYLNNLNFGVIPEGFDYLIDFDI
ncbi:MAG: lipase family protein [Waterburya sp.]